MTTKYFTDNATVESSAISEYWYDRETGDLFVEFTGGQRAGYLDVPMSAFQTFRDAESKGVHYTWSIKPAYKGQSSKVELVRRTTEVSSNPCESVGDWEVTYSATFTSKVHAVSPEDAVAQIKKVADVAGVTDLAVKSVTLRFE